MSSEKDPGNLGKDGTTAEIASCDPEMTRKEFITKVLKGGALTGALLAAPKVIDKFLVPPAYALGFSSCNTGDTAGLGDVSSGGGTDAFTAHADAICTGSGDTPPGS